MPTTEGMLVRIVVNSVYLQQQVRNVFTYRVVAGDPADGMQGIAGAFWNHVETHWRACVMNDPAYRFETVSVYEIGGILQYGEHVILPAEQQGTRTYTGQGQPPSFLAAHIKLSPATRQVRPGGKRICGFSEADYTDNEFEPAYMPFLQSLANTFDDEITGVGLGTTIEPVVLGMPTPTRPSMLHVRVVSADASPLVTTQRSRRIGSGL